MDATGMMREAVEDAGLGEYWPRLEPLLEPAVNIRTRRAESELPVGLSKFGGEPDLAPDEEWPLTKGGKPLRFLGQIDLSEVAPLLEGAPVPLPPSGLLSFFFHDHFYGDEDSDPEVHGYSVPAVLYAPDIAAVERRRSHVPASPPVHLRFESVVSLPDATDPRVVALFGGEEVHLGRYSDMIMDTYIELTGGDSPPHRLLGHANFFGGDAESKAALQAERHGVAFGDVPGTGPGGPTYVSAEEACRRAGIWDGVEDWRLLTRFEFDPNLEWSWGKAGIVYFLLPGAEIAARDFRGVVAENYFV